MKKNNKKIGIRILLILVLIAIVILGVIYFLVKAKREKKPKIPQNEVINEFVEILADGSKLNTSNKLKETKKVNGIEFLNIKLINKNGQTVLLADVKNTTETETDYIVVDITLVDKEGNTISEITGIIKPLKPGETAQFNVGTQVDYTNSYDFKIKIR